MSDFKKIDSTLDKSAGKAIEEMLVQFPDILTGHTFDIAINIDLKEIIKPIDEGLAFSQSLHAIITWKEDFRVKLAYYTKIVKLPFYLSANISGL